VYTLHVYVGVWIVIVIVIVIISSVQTTDQSNRDEIESRETVTEDGGMAGPARVDLKLKGRKGSYRLVRRCSLFSMLLRSVSLFLSFRLKRHNIQ
jgi:quinol-cytochrome oxidoreductase complex cytochrome b subunit